MNFLTGRYIPRRTFLRTAGATFGLPFLDAMVPAGRLRATTADEIDRTLLICIENSNGVAGADPWGATQNYWSPAAVGRDFDLSPSALSPLEPFRDYLTIISGTDIRPAESYNPSEIGGDHFRSTSVFLTQSHPKRTEGSDVYVGTSLDQIHAQRFGRNTPVPSMQLCIENTDQGGGCYYGYTCTYTDVLSWASADQPLPALRSPRVAFEQLFGAGSTAKERSARRRADASILDWITENVAQLKRELGPTDQARMDDYLESIREIERRIQLVEARNVSGDVEDLPEAPPGVPETFEEHIQLMFDLQVLALEADVTRVFSLKMGRDVSSRVYPKSGSDRPFHTASHHGGRQEGITAYSEINRYHVSMLPYLLEKLQSRMEGDASLLDKSLIMYGSPIADGNRHNHRGVPLILLGHANGKLPGGLHLKAPDGTPMANVMLSMLDMLGHHDTESFGDSSGHLTLG